MKRALTVTLLASAVGVLVVPAVLEADGWRRPVAPDGELCFDVESRIEVSFVTEGCTSVVGMCTEGRLRPRRGFLGGTTRFEATGLGGGVVGEDSIVFPPAEPPTTWSYSGLLRIDTPVGLLETEDVGVFDTARGMFTEMNRVTGGTGLLSDATGELFVSGYSYPDGTGFAGDVTGRVCVPRRVPGRWR